MMPNKKAWNIGEIMNLPTWDKCEEIVRHAKWQVSTNHIGRHTGYILAMDARREELEHELRCIHGELGEFREAEVSGKVATEKIKFLRKDYESSCAAKDAELTALRARVNDLTVDCAAWKSCSNAGDEVIAALRAKEG